MTEPETIGAVIGVRRADGEGDAAYRSRLTAETGSLTSNGLVASMVDSLLLLHSVERATVINAREQGHFVVVCLGGDRGSVFALIDTQRGAGTTFDLEHWPVDPPRLSWWVRAWRWVTRAGRGD